MSKIPRLFTFLIVLLLATGILAGVLNDQRAVAAAWEEKVDPWVLQTATEQSQTEFLVYLTEQADLSATATMQTKLEKGTYVYETLTALAANTQKPILAQLDALNVEHKSFWVANMIWVRGDLSVVQAMAQRDDVAHLYANPTVPFEALPDADQEALLNPEAIEWNITMVNADDVWAAGVTGAGAVIAGQDTGYDWDHPALKNQYRGWNGTTADHNYNWFDAIGGNGPCPDPGIPCDDNGHGTHTMGTMVGDDGGTNQIGMAPGAKWIACRNMDQGNGTPATYSTCYQFFIAPTDVAGNNPNPAMAPDVINNSWGCPVSEGCTDPNVMQTIVENVVAAGILTAHSAGNEGSSCSSVQTPSAIYDASFTVGSTTSSNTMSSFSSRGPVTVDGSGRMKPDISAPGSNIRSSLPGTGYGSLSGTSMAGPHVAGLTALLISANPSLAGHVPLLEDIMKQTAVLVTVNPPQTCGGVSSAIIPNNTFGWGRIDAWEAYQVARTTHLIELTKTASADDVAPGEVLTYTLNITHSVGVTLTHNVMISDVIPANTTFVTATVPHAIADSTVFWTVPDLDVDESYTVQLVVEVHQEATGVVSNADYAVSSDEIATTFGAPVNTPIQFEPYALALQKTASASYIAPGEQLTYTLSITHTSGFGVMHQVLITDVLPANTTFITATWPHTLTGSTVSWPAPDLNPGASYRVQMVVAVSEEATGLLSNTDYGASSDKTGPVLGSPVNTNVIAFGLGLHKTASAPYVLNGDLLTYTLTVDNQHPFSQTTGLILTDTLPVGTTFVTTTLPYGLDGNTVEWSLGSLAPLGTWEVQLVVQVNEEASGTVDNTDYAVFSDQVSSISGAIVSTPIETLGVALSPNHSALALPGDLVTYTHTLLNSGTLTDTYALTYTSSAGWTAQLDSPVTLGPGETVTVTLVLSVPVDAILGTTDTLTITATSQTDPSVSATATNSTTLADSYWLYLPLVAKSE